MFDIHQDDWSCHPKLKISDQCTSKVNVKFPDSTYHIYINIKSSYFYCGIYYKYFK